MAREKNFTLILMAIGLMLMAGQSSCISNKNEFSKKKYKIRKGQPPAQRYYNKYSIFRRKPDYPKTLNNR